MKTEFKNKISFTLNGTKISKKIKPVRVITYDENENIHTEFEIEDHYLWTHEHDVTGKLIKSIKTDSETNEILDERIAAERIKKSSDGIVEETYYSEDGLISQHKRMKGDEIIYEVYRERDLNKKFKYARDFEKGVMTEVWYPIPGNRKVADIKISENGNVITGKRSWSDKDHIYTEEFSDGSKGYAKFTDDNSKLLHLVDRTGFEQVNELDEEGNIRTYKLFNWEGFKSWEDYTVSKNLSYSISEKEGVREEGIRETEFSSDGKKIRTVTYKVI